MTLNKGFLKKNRPYKKNYQRSNHRLISMIIILVIILIALIYFGIVKL